MERLNICQRDFLVHREDLCMRIFCINEHRAQFYAPDVPGVGEVTVLREIM